METGTQTSLPCENVEDMYNLSEVASSPSLEGDSEIMEVLQYLVF